MVGLTQGISFGAGHFSTGAMGKTITGVGYIIFDNLDKVGVSPTRPRDNQVLTVSTGCSPFAMYIRLLPLNFDWLNKIVKYVHYAIFGFNSEHLVLSEFPTI